VNESDNSVAQDMIRDLKLPPNQQGYTTRLFRLSHDRRSPRSK
jgi:hypothetical protein